MWADHEMRFRRIFKRALATLHGYPAIKNLIKKTVFPGNQDDYEYLRKFSSNEDCVNSSPTSSSFQYPIYSHQIDKNGENICFSFCLTRNNNFPCKDFIMDGYYSPSRQNIATSTVNYNNNVITNKANMNLINNELPTVIPVVRVVKRRNTANKKERRRTQSINSAYTSLRDHIPNVPSDTKLSKVS